ncbi:MAG TPA: glyceraldehyde 3-phosphate dehydrogenase NAD-binding domain-containing protein [Chitinophagaceae bacterium]|nr:glyceraldehyde 3-phosphate dehydrogenase NAD-binding domain-containing protein [Chitinophagaceae bacterium]
MRIAINGMGRIGRLLFRKLVNHPDIELVAVNDIMPADNLAYLLKYDSVYGTFDQEIILKDQSFGVNGKKIAALNADHPSKLPWKELKVDVVLECSGKFTSKTAAEEHLKAGAQKVLLSTTGSEDVPLMIYGFNQNGLANDTHIISPGGCMTNCSVHILYILQSIGVKSAQLNILHSYTSRQELVDAPHKHFRRGRAASESIIPVEIDLHHSIERLMPALKDKIAAVSTRVPVANGAMADFSIQLSSDVSAKQINTLFKKAAGNEYKGILEYTEDPLVSLDIKGNTHSCIIDGTLTSVVGNHLKLIAWFDNEYGFTSRMVNWLEYWKKQLLPGL